MKEVMKQYDAIIIGFGKAGKTLAAELSNRGWQVAVVERSSMMYGGTCPNIACIPTKTLVHEAGIAALLYHDDYPKQANLYKQAIGRKNRLTSFLRNNNYERLSKRPNVTVYTGEGSFVSANIIKVALPEGDIELQGKEIFINTGSTPIIPAIDGIKESQKVYTSTTLLDLNVLPQHLIIVGGGYIGLEFASMYAEFGSKVTLLEGGNRFMPRNDQDIANSVKEVLEKKGIEIHLNARAQSIHDTNDGVTLTYSDVSDGTPYFVDGDAILIATGRKPMIEGLNLQATGIGVDAHGAIVVNDQLRTTVPHVWAMGDVKGGPQFTYLSLDDFRIIRDQLFGDKKRDIGDRDPVPYAVFIDPPLAHIGLTEEEALKRGYSFKVSRLPATSVVRSRTLKQTDGMLKAIVNDHSGKIMGCTLFCAEAPEIINIVAMAMKTGQHYTFLRDFIFTHPSMSEGLNELFDI
jgi:pyruvate/2-oxoglutarate dehydrogenase complex dihydrolipoamide dehydrogenase (E3) component